VAVERLEGGLEPAEQRVERHAGGGELGHREGLERLGVAVLGAPERGGLADPPLGAAALGGPVPGHERLHRPGGRHGEGPGGLWHGELDEEREGGGGGEHGAGL